MKYFKYTFIMFVIILNLNALVNASNADILNKIENDLYGFSYTNDKTKNRVERLEKTIYGKANSGDINKRITKLSGDISADVIGLEINPSRDSFMEDDKISEDSSVEYPIVDEIEQKLFKRTYKDRDLHTRIVTIEKKLFGKIYDIDDYSVRMDRIKSKIMPEALAKQEDFEYENERRFSDSSINSADIGGTAFSRFSMPFGQKNYTRPYTNYGNYGLANEQTNESPNNLNDDLSQLEYEMFGTEFSNEDTHTRIKRLNSVNKAKKSSHKYDSQKFSQHMSTAMEIGAMILMILAMVL
jgi:hypothetical protein